MLPDDRWGWVVAGQHGTEPQRSARERDASWSPDDAWVDKLISNAGAHR